jgi:mono/diheme cytochrome c family protein
MSMGRSWRSLPARAPNGFAYDLHGIEHMKMKLRLLAVCTLVVILSAQDSTSRSVWDGVYSDKQAMRGEALYSEQCARCHGAALSGGDEAPALVGGAFQSNWNGLTLGDLFDRIRGSMPADQPGKLRREQVADILAYLLRANEFPVGSAELEYRVEFLKQIRFEAVKPEKQK